MPFLNDPLVIAIIGGISLASLAMWLGWLFEDVGNEFARYDIEHTGIYFLMLPLARKLGDLPKSVANIGPFKDYSQWAERQLAVSGMDNIFTAKEYVGSHALLAIMGAVFPLILLLAFPGMPTQRVLGVCVIVGLVTSVLPFYFLNQMISDRKRDIFHSMPYFLDLLTLLVEAGMEFTMAIERTTTLLGKGPLCNEMRRFSGDLNLGRSREEALMELADRVDLVEMKSFVTALLQQQELGTPLGKVLRTQAEIMRFRRVQVAEELANKAPVKIMIPMVLFIFPSIFLILIGPMIIRAGMQKAPAPQ